MECNGICGVTFVGKPQPIVYTFQPYRAMRFIRISAYFPCEAGWGQFFQQAVHWWNTHLCKTTPFATGEIKSFTKIGKIWKLARSHCYHYTIIPPIAGVGRYIRFEQLRLHKQCISNKHTAK